jgi:hypothetical protein
VRCPFLTFFLAVDVFGKRFQNELEQLKKEAAKWQNFPAPDTPIAPVGGNDRTKNLGILSSIDSPNPKQPQLVDVEAGATGSSTSSRPNQLKERIATME